MGCHFLLQEFFSFIMHLVIWRTEFYHFFSYLVFFFSSIVPLYFWVHFTIIFLNFHRNFLLNMINIELSLDQLGKDWHLYIVEYIRYTYDSLNFREWETNPMVKKWAINLNRNFTKEDVQKFKNNVKVF